MTPIEISERLIAVEVPKDIKNPEIVQNIYYKEWWLISDNVDGIKLKDGYSYKYWCLSSQKYKRGFFDEEFDLLDAMTHELNKQAEYALITREKE